MRGADDVGGEFPHEVDSAELLEILERGGIDRLRATALRRSCILGDFLRRGDTRAMGLRELVEPGREALRFDGFAHAGHHAGRLASTAGFLGGIGGQGDHRHAHGMFLGEVAPRRLDAVEHRHVDVHEGEIENAIGQSVEEIIQLDLQSELKARALYLEAADYCVSVRDRVTKDLFEKLAADEEDHIDFLETQIELIRQVGVQLYAQKHIGGLDGDK